MIEEVIKIKIQIKKNENNKQNAKDNFEFFEGAIKAIDIISPSYINLQNPKMVEIDEVYYSSLLVVNYYREQTDLLLKNLIDTNINMNISMFYEKKDSYKTIRELTYHIGNVGVDLQTKNQNRGDMDIAAFTYNDARYIRKQMQVNNEELYFLYIYLNLFSQNKGELEYMLNKIEGIVQSKGMRDKTRIF